MKLFVSIVTAVVVGWLGGATASRAQEPTAERVVHLPGARVGGTHHRATPVILPPPTNVYERATRRDRARASSSEPSTRRIRRDL